MSTGNFPARLARNSPSRTVAVCPARLSVVYSPRGFFDVYKGIEMGAMTGGLGLVFTIFAFVLAVLWFFLPFAIFGTKDKLAEIIAESKKTNAELARIAAELAATRTAMAPRLPDVERTRDV